MNIPTQKAAADKVAALEHAEAGLVVSSGMAAIVAGLMAFVQAGGPRGFPGGPVRRHPPFRHR